MNLFMSKIVLKIGDEKVGEISAITLQAFIDDDKLIEVRQDKKTFFDTIGVPALYNLVISLQDRRNDYIFARLNPEE